MSTCPFCRRDPYHYVDNGLGMVPVAVECCDLGIMLYAGAKVAEQTLRNMRSHSPHKKAKAMRVMREHWCRPEKKGRAQQ